MDYWKETIEVKKGAQLGRMKAVCIFNPLHILDNKISVSDIDGLTIRKDIKGKDTFDLLIGGSQTVQHYQDSRTCSVQY